MNKTNFGKWEAMSITTHIDNNPHNDTIIDTEEYLLDEKFYNGEVSLEQHLTQHYKGEFVTTHNYRYLIITDDEYEAGDTFTNQYYVTSEGEIITL